VGTVGTMAVSQGQARASFARFVRRAVDEAKNSRGWSVTRLAAETGVGRSTLFRWLAGDWHDFPEVATVRGFCEALDIPVGAALGALGLRAGGAPVPDDPAVADDLRVILERLADPATSAGDKRAIRDGLRILAARFTQRQLSA
jgi:transcriptional regulator with XRE-family HTH domain